MRKETKVLCIKTSFNYYDKSKINYLEGKKYDAVIVFDDILVEDETGQMAFAGQIMEDGHWDSWFVKHFKLITLLFLYLTDYCYADLI